jgi:hypothetical protein
MSAAVLHSETFPEGYHLTTTGAELRVEATEASPCPLRQDRQQLARFSPSFLDDHMWRCGLDGIKEC